MTPLKDCRTLTHVRVKRLKMKQDALAEKHRVAQSTLSKLENGHEFDQLQIEFYMHVYGIKSEKRFRQMQAAGAISDAELEMRKPIPQDSLFAATRPLTPAEILVAHYSQNPYGPAGQATIRKQG